MLGAGEIQPTTQLESPKVLRKGVDSSGAEQVMETTLTTTNKPILLGEASLSSECHVQEFPCQGTKQGNKRGSGRRGCQGGCWCPAGLIVHSGSCQM